MTAQRLDGVTYIRCDALTGPPGQEWLATCQTELEAFAGINGGPPPCREGAGMDVDVGPAAQPRHPRLLPRAPASMTLTPKQRRALEVLAAECERQPAGINPGRFGELMYPDTAGHVNAARGLAPHAARSQAAGSVLARLRRLGWVDTTDRDGYTLHRISPAGRSVLASSPRPV